MVGFRSIIIFTFVGAVFTTPNLIAFILTGRFNLFNIEFMLLLRNDVILIFITANYTGI